MEKLVLTSSDFDKDNDYIGGHDLTALQMHLEIDAELGFVKFKSLVVAGYILAKAGSGIKAGWGIEAGEGIKAGWGIEAGWWIICKTTLNTSLRIFAGLCLWRLPEPNEKKISCGKLESGEVCYGDLVETGVGSEESQPEQDMQTVINGDKYN